MIVRIVLAAMIAILAMIGIAAPASACTATDTTAVALTEAAIIDGADNGIVSVDEFGDCTALVTYDADGVMVWQDWTSVDGVMVPVAFCEGDETPYAFTMTTDADADSEYVLTIDL